MRKALGEINLRGLIFCSFAAVMGKNKGKYKAVGTDAKQLSYKSRAKTKERLETITFQAFSFGAEGGI